MYSQSWSLGRVGSVSDKAHVGRVIADGRLLSQQVNCCMHPCNSSLSSQYGGRVSAA